MAPLERARAAVARPVRERGGDGRIPFRLRLGVSGHRRIDDVPAVRAQLEAALRSLTGLPGTSPETPVRFTVVSALAEGADRLVAREVLKRQGARLEAALPLPRDDYERDFETDDSRRDFDDLLRRARQVTQLEGSGTREDAYEQVGRFVTDRSDLLIAIWDGAPSRGRGGTADVVAYARDRGKPVIVIDPTGRSPAAVDVADIGGRALRDLAFYNGASIATSRLEDGTLRLSFGLRDLATRWPEEARAAQVLSAWLWPYYVRADGLAVRFQRRYEAVGTALFTMAAAAAVVGAAGVLVPSGAAPFAWLEAGLMAGLLLVVGAGRRMRLHDRWISSRFLAERFRSAFFLAAAGLGGTRECAPDPGARGPEADEWLRRAFAEVWDGRPRRASSRVDATGLRHFLADAWIDDQARYHRRASRRNEQRQRAITAGISIVFGMTLVIALLQGLDVGGGQAAYALALASALGFLASTLPAIGGSLGGIRSDREYERHAERFGRMATQLEELKRRMERAPDMRTIRAVATQTEELMLEENRDWFVVVRFHDFELSA